MKLKRHPIRTAAILLLLGASFPVNAKISLAPVFSDHMVIQQKTNVAIWGKAEPGKTVDLQVPWSKTPFKTRADEQGNWTIKVPTPSYGGPYKINISDGSPFQLSDVMVGDVWICSGQSNMEMPLAGWGKIDNYQQEIKDAKYPNIRLLQVSHTTSNSPLETLNLANNGWTVCNPENVAEFSATAYFFAREVYRKTGIPIGLIHTSWGGTIAEAWTSPAGLKNFPEFAEAIEKQKKAQKPGEYETQLKDWEKMVLDRDEGYKSGEPQWLDAQTDESNWRIMRLPSLWEDSALPDFDGIVYFRKKVTLPASWKGQELTLHLGTIDDNDLTYFNGKKIGETKGYNLSRNYKIAADQLAEAENTISIRVFDGSGGGGIYGEPSQLSISAANGESIDLSGDWQYKIGLDLKKVPPMPVSENQPNRPTVLYNAMIHPFLNFAIKGAIWYQGESNADRAHQYRTLFPAMISDWRKSWNIGDFPFYFVQLADFMKAEPYPAASAWAELRDAQRGSLELNNTGMAVAIDIGNPADIHPKNKQEVGRRLALIALAKTYGKQIPYSGPVLKAHTVDKNTIKLDFDSTDGSLKAKNGPLKGFAIAGADQVFHWAEARIVGNQILVSSPNVPTPVAVRYGWSNNPECNLYNQADLPASPFRTDDWADSTLNKK